jgi:threonine dehydrogenase-like Zn-dependent dehydrogenase
VVVHAAAGGTGSLAVQLARKFGAGRIIATASSVQKRALALELGADAAIDGDAAGYRERVLDANHGRPADIVLDAIGGPVLDAALDTLGPLGRLVTCGASSRQAAAAIAPSRLAADSITVAGFWVIPLIARNGTAGGNRRSCSTSRHAVTCGPWSARSTTWPGPATRTRTCWVAVPRGNSSCAPDDTHPARSHR